jgi:restriction endonuclease S subunit
MPHIVEIRDIAELRNGYTFKKKVENNPAGAVSVIQPKDIENGDLTQLPAKVPTEEITLLDNHLLKTDDLILANKGIRFSTFIYQGLPNPCIAAGSFFVITPNAQKVLSGFLQWFLSQDHTIERLRQLANSFTVPSLTLSKVGTLKMPMPSITAQEKIIEMSTLMKAEETITQQLLSRKRKYVNSFGWNLINSNDN